MLRSEGMGQHNAGEEVLHSFLNLKEMLVERAVAFVVLVGVDCVLAGHIEGVQLGAGLAGAFRNHLGAVHNREHDFIADNLLEGVILAVRHHRVPAAVE